MATAAIIGAATIGSAIIGARASDKATRARVQATEKATDTTLIAQRESIAAQERALERVIALNEPFRQAGLSALTTLEAEIEAGAPTFDEFVQSPEAAAIREQELADITKATERTAAARGTLFAPSTQLALQDRALVKTRASKLGQFENVLSRRQSELSNLTNLVNIGRGATTQQATAVGGTGANISNIISSTGAGVAGLQTSAGEARASGFINTGNILSKGVSTFAEDLALSNILKKSGGGTIPGLPLTQ